jgi:IS6 family transposase
VDETYIKVKKVWMYLYRAVDSDGKTIEFLLSPTRDAEAAKHFFTKALGASAHSVPQTHSIEKKMAQLPVPMVVKARNAAPRVINVDKNAAYPKALAKIKANGLLPVSVELRQVKYLNNLIEQDHRAHQTVDQAWDGVFLVRDGMANTPGLRDHEHDTERANARSGKRRCERPGGLDCQPLWSRHLGLTE